MIIAEDTRNQIGKHKYKNDWFKKHNIEVVRTKLYCGDYSLLTNQSICIDTKQDWVEVASNICGKQHERFRNECIRAKMGSIRLVILVEDKLPLKEWKSPTNRKGKPYTLVKSETLQKCIKTMSEKYGVEFVWVVKEEAPKKICEILGVDYETND